MSQDKLKAIEARANRARQYYDSQSSIGLKKLASQLNVKHIFRSDSIPDAATIRIRGGYAVFINPDQPETRQRFSLAHELAHILIQPDLLGADRLKHEDSEKRRLEKLCDQVAASLLMPSGAVRARLKVLSRSPETVVKLAREFRVSTQAVALKIVSVTSNPYAIVQAGLSERTGRLSVEWACASPNTIFRSSYIPPDKHLDSIPQFTEVAEQPSPNQVTGYVDLRLLGFGPCHHVISRSRHQRQDENPVVMSVIDLRHQLPLSIGT